MSNVDVEKLQKSLEKMASTINKSARHTEKIPDIQKKVDQTTEGVIELKTEMRGMTDRVSKVEVKVDEGHACQIPDTIAALKDTQREASQKIELDVQHGIKQSGEITALKKETSEIEADVQDIKKVPRRMFYSLISIVITILVGSGGAVWFLAELSKDVEFERQQRTDQFERIETQIKAVGTKADPAQIRNELVELEQAVKTSNGHEEEFHLLCDGMPTYQRRTVRKVLLKNNRRIPESCLRE